MQAKQDMHRDLADATATIQDIVTLVRKQAAQIKQDAARSHADIAAARRRVQTSFAEHCEACRCTPLPQLVSYAHQYKEGTLAACVMGARDQCLVMPALCMVSISWLSDCSFTSLCTSCRNDSHHGLDAQHLGRKAFAALG